MTDLERQFTEANEAVGNTPEGVDPRSITEELLASNAASKRVMADRAVGAYELDIDPSTIDHGDYLTFSVVNNVITLQATAFVAAPRSIGLAQLDTDGDVPMHGEFFQWTNAGLRWSAVPRQTNITVDELANDFELPLANLANITTDALPDNIPQSKLSLSLAVDDLPTIPYTKLSGTPSIPSVPATLPPTDGSVEVDSLADDFLLPLNKLAALTAAVMPTGTLIYAGTPVADKIPVHDGTEWVLEDKPTGGGGTPFTVAGTKAQYAVPVAPNATGDPSWSLLDENNMKSTTQLPQSYLVDLTTGDLPDNIPQSKLSLSLAQSDIPKLDITKLNVPSGGSAGQVMVINADADGFTVTTTGAAGLMVDGTQAQYALPIATAATGNPSWSLLDENNFKSTADLPQSILADLVVDDLPDDIPQSKLSLSLAVDDLPTIPYSKLSGTPSIPTALPPTANSVTPAAVSTTDTGTSGEFLQLNIDSEGVQTYNYSAALTSITANDVPALGLSKLTPPANSANHNVVVNAAGDAITTAAAPAAPALPDLVHGTPSATNPFIKYSAANSRYEVAPEPEGSGGGGIVVAGALASSGPRTGFVSGKSPSGNSNFLMCGWMHQAGASGVKITASEDEPLVVNLEGRTHSLTENKTGPSTLPSNLGLSKTLGVYSSFPGATGADWAFKYCSVSRPAWKLGTITPFRYGAASDAIAATNGDTFCFKYGSGNNIGYILCQRGSSSIASIGGQGPNQLALATNASRLMVNTSSTGYTHSAPDLPDDGAVTALRVAYVFIDPINDWGISMSKRIVGNTHKRYFPAATSYDTGDMMLDSDNAKWYVVTGSGASRVWSATNRVSLGLAIIDSGSVVGVVGVRSSIGMSAMISEIPAPSASSASYFSSSTSSFTPSTDGDIGGSSDTWSIGGVSGNPRDKGATLGSFLAGGVEGFRYRTGSITLDISGASADKFYAVYYSPFTGSAFYEETPPIWARQATDTSSGGGRMHPHKFAAFIGTFVTDTSGNAYSSNNYPVDNDDRSLNMGEESSWYPGGYTSGTPLAGWQSGTASHLTISLRDQNSGDGVVVVDGSQMTSTQVRDFINAVHPFIPYQRKFANISTSVSTISMLSALSLGFSTISRDGGFFSYSFTRQTGIPSIE